MDLNDMDLSLDDYIMKRKNINIETKIWRNPKNNTSQQWRLQPEYRGRYPGMPRLIESVKKNKRRQYGGLRVVVENYGISKQNLEDIGADIRFSRRPQMDRPIRNRLFTNKHHATGQGNVGYHAPGQGNVGHYTPAQRNVGNYDERNFHQRRSCERNQRYATPEREFGFTNQKYEYKPQQRREQNVDVMPNTSGHSLQRNQRGRSCPRVTEDDKMSICSGRSSRSVTSVTGKGRFSYKGHRSLNRLDRTYNPNKYVADYVNYNIVPDALPTALHDRFAMYNHTV